MKPQADLHDVSGVPWTEPPKDTTLTSGPGVVEKLLSVDPKNPDYNSRLVRLPKGFRGAAPLSHPFWEEVYVLEGVLVDEGNGVTAKAGDYCCRHPGMKHGPFYCPEEVIAFEIHYMPAGD